MSNDTPTLLFVYNADSGLFNTLSDIAHKILSPDTYACNLCAITHSYFSMRKPWGDFLGSLNVKLEFLHKDELYKQYGDKHTALPAVFFKNGKRPLELAITADTINQYKTLEELQTAIKNLIAEKK
ncbi:hypothetical protein JYT31_00235 [Beggiatoa alba]|nr:hypothetical protein [Beggiatoa alba]